VVEDVISTKEALQLLGKLQKFSQKKNKDQLGELLANCTLIVEDLSIKENNHQKQMKITDMFVKK
jgi:hypothetical protein